MDSEQAVPPADPRHDAEFAPALYRPSRRTLALLSALALAALVALVFAGAIPRVLDRAAARRDDERAATEPARVSIVNPKPAATRGSLSLPGSVQPLKETVVFARANGYVRSYSVDLGDAVREGQIMAEIEIPEVDQELRQAQASTNQSKALVEQAKTQRELAQVEMQRYTSLVPSGVVSQQETDERKATLDSQRANVQAAEAALASSDANVRRLRELKSFALVTAPFDGVVTARLTETGQLVTAGITSGQALFRVSRTDVMRVFVNVPQLYAPSVRVGDEATLSIREFPDRAFKGTITRTANELDSATRTLLTEVRVPNADRALIAGMYAELALPIARSDAPLLVPSTALVFNADGTRLALVLGDEIHWRTVKIDSDMGDQLAIASGLRETDAVVARPSDRLVEGMKVRAESAR
ncbi:MAG: efflux RND transporter periplasmic adaptor subunit [Polyangiaceae bacterium]|jgi:RND family efflux transporter MFP subunit